ncbi:helix-turn-helix domain-containing protein [Methylobacillus pratensis]
MSVLMMAQVFKRYPNGDGEMLLALAIADHADDEGENIYPSVKTLAEKTRQSERTVQRYLRKMVEIGWLIPVWENTGGRGKTSEYRISPAWIKGDNLSPFNPVDNSDKRVTPEVERVTPVTQKGDIAVSPEPSLTIKNHHLSARESASESTPPPADQVEAVVDVLQRAWVQVSSGNSALRELVEQGFTIREAADCASIARQKKPGEAIPWAYLVKVIQTQRDQGLVCRQPSHSNSPPWWLDPDKIAAKAYELRLVNGTITDRRRTESTEFQQQVLRAAGASEDVWAQWRAWRLDAA